MCLHEVELWAHRSRDSVQSQWHFCTAPSIFNIRYSDCSSSPLCTMQLTQTNQVKSESEKNPVFEKYLSQAYEHVPNENPALTNAETYPIIPHHGLNASINPIQITKPPARPPLLPSPLHSTPPEPHTPPPSPPAPPSQPIPQPTPF